MHCPFAASDPCSAGYGGNVRRVWEEPLHRKVVDASDAVFLRLIPRTGKQLSLNDRAAVRSRTLCPTRFPTHLRASYVLS